MDRQLQSRPRPGGHSAPARGRARASRVQPVVGFVSVQQATKLRKPDTQDVRLAEKATEWLHLLNTRQLRALDELVAEDATCHDDGMWLLQPAKGRAAIRGVWRDWLRSIPDYRIDVLHVATEPATNDAFVMWRASGMARLSLIPQRPTTNKPFEHCGVTRLHFDPSTGYIKDQWTWRGATADEAAWLLSRSYKPFDADSFLGTHITNSSSKSTLSATTSTISSSDSLLDGLVSVGDLASPEPFMRSKAKDAALAFKEAFGAVPGADVHSLTAALSEDYECKEGTGVWRAVNLGSREACLDYCQQRQAQLGGNPYWHSEALTADGRMMFVHFQNVLMNKHSKTLMGLSSGILVHCFDEDQRIRRSVMFRGPMSFSERAQYFAMDCRGCGNSQAEKLGVDESLFGGL